MIVEIRHQNELLAVIVPGRFREPGIHFFTPDNFSQQLAYMRHPAMCLGKNIHKVRDDQRDRLAIHYHQSYQVRHFRRTKPRFLMDVADSPYPIVHLFDEPQFNTQDGYIGFMLDFFRRLRRDDKLVFLCVHPNEAFHLEILREACEQFIFVNDGRLTHATNFDALVAHPPVRDYLGALLDSVS
jgi:hypothetical protein